MRACIVADSVLGRYLEEEGEGRAEEPCASLSFFVLRDSACQAPWTAPPADLYVLPAALFLDLGECGPRPAFAYGPVSLIAEVLQAGAADFLRSPWTVEELEARASRLAGFRIRLAQGLVELEGRDLASGCRRSALTEAEFRVLALLAANRGQAVPRRALAMRLWGKERDGSRAVDAHISCLRRKFEAVLPGSGRAIEACRNQGYRLVGIACG